MEKERRPGMEDDCRWVWRTAKGEQRARKAFKFTMNEGGKLRRCCVSGFGVQYEEVHLGMEKTALAAEAMVAREQLQNWQDRQAQPSVGRTEERTTMTATDLVSPSLPCAQ